MKFKATVILYLFSFNLFADTESNSLPHFELDMTGKEYQSYFETHPKLLKILFNTDAHSFQEWISQTEPDNKETDVLRICLKIGARNLAWLDAINSKRASDDALELWTPENTSAYPITQPRYSSREMVTNEYHQLLSELPIQVKELLFSTQNIPDHTLGMDTPVYLHWARKIDTLYQRASRWLSNEPFLSSYASMSKNDLRGLFVLSKTEKLTEKLANWKNNSDQSKTELFRALVGICKNNHVSKDRCTQELSQLTEDQNSALSFYQKYNDGATKLYQRYFKLSNARQDITWKNTHTSIPFLDPQNLKIKSWLKENIEDEWKFNSWNLKLEFVDSGMGHARVQFKAGATPHVNGIGGDIITMDANLPLLQYSSRWTIRHEFGHVLGFPDCYLEFYDSDQKVMVNYQLDTTNLMCSRKGKLKETHFNEMKRVYQN